ALRAQHVERIGRHVVVGLVLKRKQSDLRAVAVGHDEPVLDRNCGENVRGTRHVRALDGGFERLTPAQERVAAESHDDEIRVHDAIPSRSMGQLMQRGPPRPRPSSLPAIVMTSIPPRRSFVFVSTLRSYATTTPGATARTLLPSSHCSRSASTWSPPVVMMRSSGTPRAAAISPNSSPPGRMSMPRSSGRRVQHRNVSATPGYATNAS